MQTLLPKPVVGKTFIIAVSLLGLITLGELLAVWRAYAEHSQRTLLVAQQGTAPETKLIVEDTFTPEPRNTPPLAAPTPVTSQNPATSTPVQQLSPGTARPPSAINTQLAALIEQARALRERGDTSTALIRLREAATISPNDPEVLCEMAITYEKMGLVDKALDHWKRVYALGESAGIYYAAADAKIKSSEAPAPTPAADATPKQEIGLQPDSILGLVDISTSDSMDPNGGRVIKLKIPVKARPNSNIEVSNVVIQVYFYDIIDDLNVVQTNAPAASINSHWSKLPADWVDSEVEILEVEYSQSVEDVKEKQTEHRKYYGYAVRVYYKNELQDIRAEPVKLLKQFPPPITLTNGAK